MMHVLRFMDALQHDYPYHATLFDIVPSAHKGDREWEQEHTFSVPISLRFSKVELADIEFWISQRTSFRHAPAVVPAAGLAPGADSQRSCASDTL